MSVLCELLVENPPLVEVLSELESELVLVELVLLGDDVDESLLVDVDDVLDGLLVELSLLVDVELCELLLDAEDWLDVELALDVLDSLLVELVLD